MNTLFNGKLNTLQTLCKENKVRSLHVFGSANTDKFTDHSDIDFLIAFDEDISIEEYTNNYFNLQYALRALFNREIDLVTEKSLSNPYLIKGINQTKQLIYGA